MTQQDETRRYFAAKADAWQREASDDAAPYSVIHHRNRTVLHVLDGLGAGARVLDVGCGSGQLVVEAARRGLRAEGNDFADAMIEKCEENRAAAGVAATFHRGSFFDLPVEPGAFDAVSALGFIEYLPLDGITTFLERCFAMLRPGGALVVGSRNRLFNLLSLNAFTLLEAELGTVDGLLRESVALQASASAEAAFAALRPLERTDPQPETHPETGIAVETRFQFSPADLIGRARRTGFVPKALFPIHVHGLPGGYDADWHARLARFAAESGFDDPRLVPRASSFVLHAERAA